MGQHASSAACQDVAVTNTAQTPLIAGRLCIHQVMMRLSELRPVFHSEADLQQSFARVLWETDPTIHTRLEARQLDKREYLDLLAIGPET